GEGLQRLVLGGNKLGISGVPRCSSPTDSCRASVPATVLALPNQSIDQDRWHGGVLWQLGSNVVLHRHAHVPHPLSYLQRHILQKQWKLVSQEVTIGHSI